jgi:hypothetical protein
MNQIEYFIGIILVFLLACSPILIIGVIMDTVTKRLKELNKDEQTKAINKFKN